MSSRRVLQPTTEMFFKFVSLEKWTAAEIYLFLFLRALTISPYACKWVAIVDKCFLACQIIKLMKKKNSHSNLNGEQLKKTTKI